MIRVWIASVASSLCLCIVGTVKLMVCSFLTVFTKSGFVFNFYLVDVKRCRLCVIFQVVALY